MGLCGGLLLAGVRVGGLFAYHQSRKRECNEERICVCISSGVDGLGLNMCKIREQNQGKRVWSGLVWV